MIAIVTVKREWTHDGDSTVGRSVNINRCPSLSKHRT